MLSVAGTDVGMSRALAMVARLFHCLQNSSGLMPMISASRPREP